MSGSLMDARSAPGGSTSLMSDVVVKPVKGWKDRRRFTELPWSLYRDDPNWIPPLRGNQKELVDYTRHPFYQNAEIQTFLACRNGEAVGRVGAIVNREHNRRYNERRGFFGFFESIDDQARGQRLVRCGPRLAEHSRDAIDPWPGEPLDELRVRLAGRWFRQPADVHDDLQSALVRPIDRDLRVS